MPFLIIQRVVGPLPAIRLNSPLTRYFRNGNRNDKPFFSGRLVIMSAHLHQPPPGGTGRKSYDRGNGKNWNQFDRKFTCIAVTERNLTPNTRNGNQKLFFQRRILINERQRSNQDFVSKVKKKKKCWNNFILINYANYLFP